MKLILFDMCLYFEMKNQERTNVYIKNMYQSVKSEIECLNGKKEYHNKSTKDLYISTN